MDEDGEGEANDEEEEAWRADVEQELQALATAQVQEGLGADDPFHISQLHIILDRTDALLDDFASRLRDGAYDPESSEYVFPIISRRSVDHLCTLVASQLHFQIPNNDTFFRAFVSISTDD
jgi:nuclear pore complex protein Nup107